MEHSTRALRGSSRRTRRSIGYGSLLVLAVVGLLLSSCGEDEDRTPAESGPTAEELNVSGWAAFAEGDYMAAVSDFSAALAKDDALHEARLGWGWSLAYSGDQDRAIAAFDELIAADAFTSDAHAGRAAAGLAVDPQIAVESALALLGADSGYVFSRRPSIDAFDFHVILAEGYFALGRYSDAHAQIDILDPDNALDIADPDYLLNLASAVETWRDYVSPDMP